MAAFRRESCFATVVKFVKLTDILSYIEKMKSIRQSDTRILQQLRKAIFAERRQCVLSFPRRI